MTYTGFRRAVASGGPVGGLSAAARNVGFDELAHQIAADQASLVSLFWHVEDLRLPGRTLRDQATGDPPMNPFPKKTSCGHCGARVKLHRKEWQPYRDAEDRCTGYTQIRTCETCDSVVYAAVGKRNIVAAIAKASVPALH